MIEIFEFTENVCKSTLFKYIEKRAIQLMEDEKFGRFASLNSCMVVILKTVADSIHGQLPDFLMSDEVNQEIVSLNEILSCYQINYEKTADKILEAVRKSVRNAEEVFNEEALITLVEIDGFDVREVVKSAVDLLKSILKAENATNAIKTYILAYKEEDSDDFIDDDGGDDSDDDYTVYIDDNGDDGDNGNDDNGNDDNDNDDDNDEYNLGSIISAIDKYKQNHTFITDAEDEGNEEQKTEGHSESNQEKETEELISLVSKVSELQNKLSKIVLGQEHAVKAFGEGYFQSNLARKIREKSNKPKSLFLFAGPPGVGKTFLAESVAKELKLPYLRLDMSDYNQTGAINDLCGSDEMYAGSHEGNLTGFVKKHPRAVLLFDEIEKASTKVIHLFLQMLDEGRLRDSNLREEVCFTNTILIFTTNVGKLLYDDPSVSSFAALPRKRIMQALSTEINPLTDSPMFPAAICSRFNSGNVVMFNHLPAHNLLEIASKEINLDIAGLEKTEGIKVNLDPRIPSVILFEEGGKADARSMKARANDFFYKELFEVIYRVQSSPKYESEKKINSFDVTISLDECSEDVKNLFEPESKPEILVFADKDIADKCHSDIKFANVYTTDNSETANDIIADKDISMVLRYINCEKADMHKDDLNTEDIISEGISFLDMVTEKYGIPVFILKQKEEDLSGEEINFYNKGARGFIVIEPSSASGTFEKQVSDRFREVFIQSNILMLARSNKVLKYRIAERINKETNKPTITLFDFKIELSTDAEDSASIINSKTKPDVCFDDIIGAEDAKAELSYFVEFIKNPKKYARRGQKVPKGVLLYGPPGTGKTLLAKAMAGESDAAFFAAEGNQFLKHYIGDGPEAVHSLFAAARKYAPSIIFVDEIDAIASDRSLESSKYTSDVLTSFLTEMDGFKADASRPVFVLAATNNDVKSDNGRSLDPALLRRFDRTIFVDLPGKDDRITFIKRRIDNSKCMKISDSLINNIATRSTGMSLADIESVIELAMRNSVRMKKDFVDDDDFDEAFETFNGGAVNTVAEDSLLRTARHEAGHALVCWLNGEMPTYLTIVSRGDHGGYMQHSDNESKVVLTKKELLGRIRTALGGRAAEIVYYGKEDGLTTGSSSDIYNATETVIRMVCSYGMDDEIGLAFIQSGDKNLSSAVIERVNRILKEQLEEAVCSIEGNKEQLERLVDALMKKNHLNENEIKEILVTHSNDKTEQ